MVVNLSIFSIKQMRNFLVKLFVFCILVISLDSLIGFGVKRMYSSVKSGTIHTLNYGFKGCNEEILFFGASEISHHFISNTISDSLKMSCYNLGYDGSGIFLHYPLFSSILKRYNPKIVIISASLLEGKKIEIPNLYPYYYQYNDVKSIINELDSTDKIKLLLNGYLYNSMIINILQGFFVDGSKLNGYLPLYGNSKFMKLNLQPFSVPITKQSIYYFSKFIEIARSKGIIVYIMSPPRYQISNYTLDKKNINLICKRYGAKYVNYLNDTSFVNHPELFKDRPHLNDKGAKILTEKFIERLKYDLKNQN